ncbi:MAG: heme ABC exporter ATP-binding protein CcmA [Alphaproteobacteria bacterium]|nr:MAG: heme ABC exporter ATP-binding protein CcmA [Alphaproteobacteria bacterium]
MAQTGEPLMAERCPPLFKLSGEGLTCLRGGRVVLQDLSFEAIAGRPLVVTGPNGAGKSTLLRLVAGLVSYQAGTLLFAGADGAPVSDESNGYLMHYLGHQDAVKPALTVVENLTYWQRLYGARVSVGEALGQLGITFLADVPGQFLSAGQKRRVNLARLLVSHRPLWVLDEPTASLDQEGAEIVRGLIQRHSAEGGLTLVTTHLDLGLEAQDSLKIARLSDVPLEGGA